MCGRFSLTREEAEIEKRFQAKFYSNDLVKRYNVAPSQLALVMTDAEPGKLQFFKWGLIPSWAKETAIGNKMINARAETIFEKPSFNRLIKNRRCLVIADGFYEWQPLGGKTKQPYRIGLQSDELFAFGGLWDTWLNKESGEIISSFTIITTDANTLVAPVHNRMPFILNKEDEKIWLDKNTPVEKIISIIKPYPSSEMKYYPVSTLVNSPANDCIEIIHPLTEKLN